MSLAADLFGYISLVVLGIVPIVNPFSTAPVFISMTANMVASQRHKTATLACIYMGLLLLVFLVLGTLILEFFGISLKSLRLAGGLVVAYMGFRMLFPADHLSQADDVEPVRDPQSIAFTPLAMPMLAGPGSISVVLAIAAKVTEIEPITDRLWGYVVVGVGIVISCAICWAVLWSSGSVVRFLGKNGIDAMTKLMGFLLICLGMEFVLDGWSMI